MLWLTLAYATKKDSTNMNLYKASAKDCGTPPTAVNLPITSENNIVAMLGKYAKATKAEATGAGISSNSGITKMEGVIFGTGTTPPTLDDYMMAGEHFTEFTASHTITEEEDDNGFTYTVVYTLTSTASEDVTISEIGLSRYANRRVNSYYYYSGFLLERTLLETPITIPAGGVGQITYTLRINYPTL